MTRAILAFTANEMLLLLTFYFGLHIVEIAQCPFAFQSKTNRQQQEQWCQYTIIYILCTSGFISSTPKAGGLCELKNHRFF